LRVSQQTNHVLSKRTLTLTLLDTWPHLTSCAVKVTGFKDVINEDIVKLFFESGKRSGGGEIDELVIDEDSKSVVVVFHSREGLLPNSCIKHEHSRIVTLTFLSLLDALIRSRSFRSFSGSCCGSDVTWQEIARMCDSVWRVFQPFRLTLSHTYDRFLATSHH